MGKEQQSMEDTIEGRQTFMNRVVEVSSRFGLEVTTNKEEVGKKNIRGVQLFINHSKIDQVPHYKYLGTIINTK